MSDAFIVDADSNREGVLVWRKSEKRCPKCGKEMLLEGVRDGRVVRIACMDCPFVEVVE
jgi:ribosomal protein S27AE